MCGYILAPSGWVYDLPILGLRILQGWLMVLLLLFGRRWVDYLHGGCGGEIAFGVFYFF